MTKTEHDAMDMIKRLGTILLGGGLALAFCCILLLLASTAISMGWVSEDSMPQLTVAGCALGTAAGALFAVLRCKNRTLLVGLSVAVVFFLLLLSIGMLVYADIALEQGGAALLCGSLCGGAAVGLFCGRTVKKKKRRI